MGKLINSIEDSYILDNPQFRKWNIRMVKEEKPYSKVIFSLLSYLENIECITDEHKLRKLVQEWKVQNDDEKDELLYVKPTPIDYDMIKWWVNRDKTKKQPTLTKELKIILNKNQKLADKNGISEHSYKNLLKLETWTSEITKSKVFESLLIQLEEEESKNYILDILGA